MKFSFCIFHQWHLIIFRKLNFTNLNYQFKNQNINQNHNGFAQIDAQSSGSVKLNALRSNQWFCEFGNGKVHNRFISWLSRRLHQRSEAEWIDIACICQSSNDGVVLHGWTAKSEGRSLHRWLYHWRRIGTKSTSRSKSLRYPSIWNCSGIGMQRFSSSG